MTLSALLNLVYEIIISSIQINNLLTQMIIEFPPGTFWDLWIKLQEIYGILGEMSDQFKMDSSDNNISNVRAFDLQNKSFNNHPIAGLAITLNVAL